MAGRELRVGDVTIVSASEGTATFGFMTLSEMYGGVPESAWGPFRERYPDCFDGAYLREAYQSFLIRSRGKVILVDTGLGERPIPFFPGVGGVLLQNLRAAGCEPEDVDIVFLTHLHIDHTGWNLTVDGRPTFPRARYLLHRNDWGAFHRPEALSNPMNGHIRHFVTPLRDLGVLELLDDDTRLTDQVTAICTPGHTEGHMSLLVASDGEKAVITGDAISHPHEITEPDWLLTAPFEADSLMANSTRKALLDRIEAEGMKVVAGHLPEPGYGDIVRLDGRRWWRSL